MKNKLYISFFLLLQANLFSQTACVQYDSNFTGFCSEFHPNGKTKWIKEFKEGQAVGVWMNFDEKGNLVKQLNTSLKRDSLLFFNEENINFPAIDSYKIDNTFQDEQKSFDIRPCCIEEPADFPGGSTKMKEWVKLHLVYPEEAINLGLSGKCYLSFMVEKDGQITNVRVLKGVLDCPMCDEEAICLMEGMPKWIPSNLCGEKARSECQIILFFTLN